MFPCQEAIVANARKVLKYLPGNSALTTSAEHQAFQLVKVLREHEFFSDLDCEVEYGKLLEELEAPWPKNSEHVLWNDVQHNLTRILSYDEAVTNFANSAVEWPSPFRGATVEFLASGRPRADPMDWWKYDKRERERKPTLFLESQGCNFLLIDRHWPGLLKKFNRTVFFARAAAAAFMQGSGQLWNHIKALGASFVPFRIGDHPDLAPDRVVIGVSKPPCLLCSWYLGEDDSEAGSW